MHLLFDLDGTLVDSLSAIRLSVNRTLEELSVPLPTERALASLVGAPLADVFASVLGVERQDLISPAVARYRVLFDEIGMAHIEAFPGIPDALTAFGRNGHVMQVVTARSSPSADLILRQLDLDEHFLAVHAPPAAIGRYDKADYVQAAMRRAGAEASHTVMVGDRADDVRSGLAHGATTVGVDWGNGSRRELESAGAHYVASSVADLTAFVAALRPAASSH